MDKICCNRCRESKAPECFTKDKSSKSGLTGTCRKCKKEAAAARYQKIKNTTTTEPVIDTSSPYVQRLMLEIAKRGY